MLLSSRMRLMKWFINTQMQRRRPSMESFTNKKCRTARSASCQKMTSRLYTLHTSNSFGPIQHPSVNVQMMYGTSRHVPHILSLMYTSCSTSHTITVSLAHDVPQDPLGLPQFRFDMPEQHFNISYPPSRFRWICPQSGATCQVSISKSPMPWQTMLRWLKLSVHILGFALPR